MDKPDWVYPGAEVMVYEDGAELRRRPARKKVLKLAAKSFTTEGPNSVSPWRFSYERLQTRYGGNYGVNLLVEPVGTLLADELLAEIKVLNSEHLAWKAAEEFRRNPSSETAEKAIQLLAAYQRADQGFRDSVAARKAAADAER